MRAMKGDLSRSIRYYTLPIYYSWFCVVLCNHMHLHFIVLDSWILYLLVYGNYFVSFFFLVDSVTTSMPKRRVKKNAKQPVTDKENLDQDGIPPNNKAEAFVDHDGINFTFTYINYVLLMSKREGKRGMLDKYFVRISRYHYRLVELSVTLVL